MWVIVLAPYLSFSVTLWLGLLLLRRAESKGLRFTSGALISFALSMALLGIVNTTDINSSSSMLTIAWQLLQVTAAAFWGAALAHLLRHQQSSRYLRDVLVISGFFLGSMLLLWWSVNQWIGLPVGLALGLVCVDLLLLGWAVARLEAWQIGEGFSLELRRSLVGSALGVGVVGGSILLVMTSEAPRSLTVWTTIGMLLLLYGLTTGALISQVFATEFQKWLDRAAQIGTPQEQKDSALLREVADASVRLDGDLDMRALDEAQFARLTRRALSYLPNLPRLAASPLVRLPIINMRLAARGASSNRLERAIELRALLSESIEQLKPREQGAAGTGEEWRHYNVLYYPYVMGLKPYAIDNDLDDHDARVVADWLRTRVPERTLHNWQKAAAGLIAQHLRELAVNGSGVSINGSH